MASRGSGLYMYIWPFLFGVHKTEFFFAFNGGGSGGLCLVFLLE